MDYVTPVVFMIGVVKRAERKCEAFVSVRVCVDFEDTVGDFDCYAIAFVLLVERENFRSLLKR